MNTIVDTDALVGLFNTRDVHNKEASRIFEELNKRGVTTLILPTTLSEFAALFADEVGMKERLEAKNNNNDDNDDDDASADEALELKRRASE